MFGNENYINLEVGIILNNSNLYIVLKSFIQISDMVVTYFFLKTEISKSNYLVPNQARGQCFS